MEDTIYLTYSYTESIGITAKLPTTTRNEKFNCCKQLDFQLQTVQCFLSVHVVLLCCKAVFASYGRATWRLLIKHVSGLPQKSGRKSSLNTADCRPVRYFAPYHKADILKSCLHFVDRQT